MSVYKHAYLKKILLLHSAFMLGEMKMPLKGEVGGHGNYIVDHGKSLKNHGIVFFNFCGNPVYCYRYQLLNIIICKQYSK